ncbi:uncharacterized protein PHACADRAFT_198772 [Phanerochaete carnosa HHB-10118-sp]|uniref:Uncharacterized protein n=1 Tax=Phanerochaete carnosa (strain HHB-10118-sp) TaxID=650164 RepID=K5W0V0_PHACS|nr:uncharacterized protein PHACADRAFT_198772 [Phanerochaete carnosa HHB-10118-sp]EKM52725.1 hypothetical protein PHACADRAFT_198772 [Phanerochaete carnosa HHB-10118-sp]
MTQPEGETSRGPGPRLPTELYRHIFQYVSSKRDLCNLSVLSRGLQNEAEFFIYHSVDSSRRAHTEYLCDLITSSPHRHTLVRSLSISNDDAGARVSEAKDREYWERIARLLHDLPYLEELKIHDNMSVPTGNKNAWVLLRGTFSLRHFDSDFVFDESLLEFLCSQRSLERLYWIESFSDDDSARAIADMDIVGPHSGSKLAPSVSVLNTNSPRFALKCMSAAILSHLWICGPCAYEDDGWMNYVAQFVESGGAKSLKSLRMNLPYRKSTLVSVLGALVKGAPELRSLGFVPIFNASDRDLIDVLSQFKHLHSLITWNVIGRETSRAVAQACPSLRLVAGLHYSYSHEYVIFPVNPLGTPRPLHDPEYLLWRGV